MTNLKILVRRDGRAHGIYSDALAGLCDKGKAEIKRASHVEPNPNGSGWTADLSPVGGPVLGPYKLRQEALDAEVAWLEARLFS